MAGLSISPPGVEVIQEFVSTSPTAITPFLPSVHVGPCFQNIDAFDDLGNPQVEAFAGTYRDGLGRVAFNLPSLISEASLVGFEDEVRVFLINGTVVTELYSEDDEEFIVEDGTGDYTAGSPAYLDDLTQLFTQIGVEVGDVVRFEYLPPDGGAEGYLGETVDIPITDIISDTRLELDGSLVPENLAAWEYDIIRNAAQFVFDAVQQANAEFGTQDNFLRYTAQLLKTDGVTPGDYLGDDGDLVSVLHTGSPAFLTGTDGAVGDAIFYAGDLDTLTPGASAADFVTNVGPIGAVTNELILIGASGSGAAFLDILYVVSAAELLIESGAGVDLTGQAWVVGDEAPLTFNAGSGVTVGAGPGPATLTVANGNFDTAIPLLGPVPSGPAQPTLVELSTGVYAVTLVTDNNTLTFTAVDGATDALPSEDPVILLETQNDGAAADGATGGLDNFVTVSQNLTTLADDATEAINFGGTTAAPLVSVSDMHNAILAAGAPFALTSGTDQAFTAVALTSALALSWDAAAHRVTVQLARAAGITNNTYAEIQAAITTGPTPGPADPAYNAVVADAINATLGGVTGDGATEITEADLPFTLQLDGGSDEEQLLLDADLLGSGTPTSQVYVSYKALRVDVSAASANFDGALYIENDDQREALLGPATVDNPLSLAVSLSLINSPTQGLYALGVGQVSASKPEGTVAAYTEAFGALEPEDIHLIQCLTSDLTVAQILEVHVDALSQPAEKAERIAFFNSVLPEYKKAEVIASGSSGNSGTGSGATPTKMTGENPAEFRTSIDLFLAGVAEGDFLVVTAQSGADDELTPVNGTVGPLYGLPVHSTPTKAGDNFVLQVDASGLTDTAWDALIDVDWTVYRPGDAISAAVDQAEVIAQTSEGFANRRMYHHWPDECTADVGGTEFLLPGYYMTAGWAGRANQIVPEQGFSEGAVAGYTGVKHSTGYFTKAHLDRIAGGGTWISYQQSQNAPIKCRHQLSTDTSSVEKREFNITRVVDYVAKYLRLGLQRQVGQFNITQQYLEALGTSIQGLISGLEEDNKILNGSLVSIEVNELQPDKIDVIVAIRVAYPANYIEITLQI